MRRERPRRRARPTPKGFLVVAARPEPVPAPTMRPRDQAGGHTLLSKWTRGFQPLADHATDFGLSGNVLHAVERALLGTRVDLSRPGDPALPQLASRILSALVHVAPEVEHVGEPRTLNVVAVCWTTTLLALSGCGRTPVEETADGNATGSATDTDATAGSATQTTGSAGSVSDSMNPTDTGGSMSASQTETGDPTSTTAPATVTATDTEPDPTVTATATETTTPSDPSVGESSSDTSSTGDSQSASDTSTSTSDGTSDTTDGTSTGADTTTTSDGTTSGTTGEEVQCGLQLQVTIRDFKFSHPDMEDYCCGQVNGLVQPDLGMNNKPVFAMVGNPKMLTDAPTFTQWYTDVPDVNQKTTIVIDLMEIMPGVYSYQNNSFFPVDNMLWGNEGQAHNYHFTTVHDTS